MKRPRSWLMGMAMVLTCSTLAFAQPFNGMQTKGLGEGPGSGRGFGMGAFLTGPMLTQVAQKIGLSKEETNKIKEIVYATEREAIPLLAKISEVRLTLKQKLDADTTPTEKDIASLIETIGKLETQLKKNQALTMLRIRKGLSLDKWRKLEAMVSDFLMHHRWPGKMMEKKGKRGPS